MESHEKSMEQFDSWMDEWDKAAKELNASTPKKPQTLTSFFSDTPAAEDYQDAEPTSHEDWVDLFSRSVELDMSGEEDNLLTEKMDAGDDKRDGFDHLVRGDKQVTKGDITYPQNPINPHSVGPDTGKEDGPIRVTKNWNDGDELDEVDQLKHEIEALERKCHKEDVFGHKGQRDKIIKQLEGLRDRVHSLSEKMQPQVDKDVT